MGINSDRHPGRIRIPSNQQSIKPRQTQYPSYSSLETLTESQIAINMPTVKEEIDAEKGAIIVTVEPPEGFEDEDEDEDES